MTTRRLALLSLSLPLALFAALLPTQPANAATVDELFAEAREAYKSGDTQRATELADRAVEAEPENPRCYAFRANLCGLLREFDQALADFDKLIELEPNNAAAYQARGSVHFRTGNVEQSVADFDKFLEMEPAQTPYHWQRGISHYYAGMYEEGRRQFEVHKTVNPDDVENAAWHFLCVAKLKGADAARKVLIPIRKGADRRVPMAEIYDLFAGRATEQDVLDAAEAGAAGADEAGAGADAGPADEERLKGQRFYAHLYLGLYYEATGEAEKARQYIDKAAEGAPDHYMGDVARVHAARLKQAEAGDGEAGAAQDGEEAEPAGEPAADTPSSRYSGERAGERGSGKKPE